MGRHGFPGIPRRFGMQLPLVAMVLREASALMRISSIYDPYGCVTDVRLINRMAGCSTGWPVDQPARDKTNTYVCAT